MLMVLIFSGVFFPFHFKNNEYELGNLILGLLILNSVLLTLMVEMVQILLLLLFHFLIVFKF